MATNANQNVQQATVVQGTEIRPGQTRVQLELFDLEGNPWNPESGGPIELPEGTATTSYVDDAIAPLVDRIEALENASE